MEQTFFIIKPDGVKRGLVGEVLKRIERRGFKLEKLELRSTVSEDLIDQHYRDLVGKSFYPPIRQFMTSGPIIVGIISGPKVIE
ncbi:nucleoside-diphosphate kinase, partial [Streptococcus pneumoniae]